MDRIFNMYSHSLNFKFNLTSDPCLHHTLTCPLEMRNYFRSRYLNCLPGFLPDPDVDYKHKGVSQGWMCHRVGQARACSGSSLINKMELFVGESLQ